ncbi:MAG: hypothetical protein AB1733_09930 [Thermodesulfobacteriota bacterium]
MSWSRSLSVLVAIVVGAIGLSGLAHGEQVATKCHITCRCLQNNSVGNFSFVVPVDRSPDIAHDADLACKRYGFQVCLDGCNSRKFSYTYQITSP